MMSQNWILKKLGGEPIKKSEFLMMRTRTNHVLRDQYRFWREDIPLDKNLMTSLVGKDTHRMIIFLIFSLSLIVK